MLQEDAEKKSRDRLPLALTVFLHDCYTPKKDVREQQQHIFPELHYLLLDDYRYLKEMRKTDQV